MPRVAHRIIIDTDLWISFLITKNFKKLDHKILSGEITLIFSIELIDEFLSVVERPKMKRYFESDDIEIIMNLIENHSEIVSPKSNVKRCRDAKDNFLLSLAQDSKANYLLTGDADLLELKNHQETIITTISEYLKV